MSWNLQKYICDRVSLLVMLQAVATHCWFSDNFPAYIQFKKSILNSNELVSLSNSNMQIFSSFIDILMEYLTLLLQHDH